MISIVFSKRLVTLAYILSLLGLFSSCAHRYDENASRQFKDAQKWSKIFDDPGRDEWQWPAEIIELMNIKTGMTVADIGAGTGYFLPHLHNAVGKSGKVLALDVEPNLTFYMAQRVVNEKLDNVQVLTVPASDPMLEDNSIDRILLVNTWHHIKNRDQYAKKLLKSLKRGGKLFIVEYKPGSGGPGPMDRHRMSMKQVIREIELGGALANQVNINLPYQYVITAQQ